MCGSHCEMTKEEVIGAYGHKRAAAFGNIEDRCLPSQEQLANAFDIAASYKAPYGRISGNESRCAYGKINRKCRRREIQMD